MQAIYCVIEFWMDRFMGMYKGSSDAHRIAECLPDQKVIIRNYKVGFAQWCVASKARDVLLVGYYTDWLRRCYIPVTVAYAFGTVSPSLLLVA